MDTLYLISLIVGGFFVLLSLFGGHDSDMDSGLDADHDASLDVHDGGAGAGLVDLLSIRALFLFAAFFGLTGILLDWTDAGEPFTFIVALLVGLIIGLGGNYLIRRIGYTPVSSGVDNLELRGRTARVLIPFDSKDKGKISLEAKGQRLQLVARAYGDEAGESFKPGDEVVVVRMHGSVAEVLKPN